MANKLSRLTKKQSLRYIFCGGCTTAVNVILFYLLREILGVSLILSNLISIGMAILFAFIVNKVIVFDSRKKNRLHVTKEFLLFLVMRLVSMVVEICGIWFAVTVLSAPDFYSKLMMQVVVISFNFFFSKYIVFREGCVSHKPV